jgi:hypothetical protein
MRYSTAPLFCLEVGVRWTARVLTALLVGLVLVISSARIERSVPAILSPLRR